VLPGATLPAGAPAIVGARLLPPALLVGVGVSGTPPADSPEAAVAPGAVAACRWLTEDELRVYSVEYERTGFQGGLNWYRCGTDPRLAAENALFAGRTIDVPSFYVAGAADWGVYQKPGDFERMQSSACTRMLGCHLVDGAGHWVQQEQPERVTDLLLGFVRQARPR
jgi:pimeloyl-ACP methyl ester carboxylesterase